LLIWKGKGAGQVDALLFSAGEVSREAMRQVFEVEKAENWVDFVVDFLRKGDVGGDRKMWEERGLLGGVGDLAVAGWKRG
jgi:hypothetical protein